MRTIRLVIGCLLATSVAVADSPATQPSSDALSPVSTPFVGGQGGYAVYRIPALAVTPAGTVLAFAEGRKSLKDQSSNDIVLRRSTDNGSTWDPLQVVADARPDSLNNPTVVVLKDDHRVLLMFQRYPADRREATVTPGVTGTTTCLCFTTVSADDGRTWSSPVDVTAQVKRATVATSIASGPGIGIQLQRGKHSGRVVIPFNQGPLKQCEVYAAYSDDGGRSWKFGQSAPVGPDGRGNEVQVAELSDGRVLLNTRSSSEDRNRKSAVSDDGGETWSMLRAEPSLPEPRCEGSLIRTDTGSLLFANPSDRKTRSHGTIYRSDDDGRSWPASREMVPGRFAYCCLAVLPDGSVGCLYEAEDYRRMELLRFPLDWIAGRTNK